MGHEIVVIKPRLRSLLSCKPFFVGICGGVVGVLVDLDHLAVLWIQGAIKPAHWHILLFSGFMVVIAVSCLGGLLVVSVLKRKNAVVKK